MWAQAGHGPRCTEDRNGPVEHSVLGQQEGELLGQAARLARARSVRSRHTPWGVQRMRKGYAAAITAATEIRALMRL